MRSALSDRMEFDHVIQVHEDGTVTDAAGSVYGPESVNHEDVDAGPLEGWTLLAGFTGQYSYNGACMHPSEYIGGRLERHILETPGLYVATVVYDGDDMDAEPVGWAVAFREDVSS